MSEVRERSVRGLRSAYDGGVAGVSSSNGIISTHDSNQWRQGQREEIQGCRMELHSDDRCKRMAICCAKNGRDEKVSATQQMNSQQRLQVLAS